MIYCTIYMQDSFNINLIWQCHSPPRSFTIVYSPPVFKKLWYDKSCILVLKIILSERTMFSNLSWLLQINYHICFHILKSKLQYFEKSATLYIAWYVLHCRPHLVLLESNIHKSLSISPKINTLKGQYWLTLVAC